jgi:hypothetical protein
VREPLIQVAQHAIQFFLLRNNMLFTEELGCLPRVASPLLQTTSDGSSLLKYIYGLHSPFHQLVLLVALASDEA